MSMYVNWDKFIWFIVCLVMIIYGLVKGIPAFWLVKSVSHIQQACEIGSKSIMLR